MKKILAILISVSILFVFLNAFSTKELPVDINDKSKLLLEEKRESKGEIIGTAGKGVVALRFDDYQDAFRENIYPLLIARGLPCSMALISRFCTAQAWGKGTTWDDIRTWNRNGVEIWSHGTDHKDYCTNGNSGLYDQIVTSKAEIEKQNIKVEGWVLPGVSPSTTTLPYNGLTSPEDYNSEVGRLIMQTYALSEAYAYNAQRILPSNLFHGLNHITVSEKTTLESSKKVINDAIKNKTGIEIMCHAGNLDKPGNMTLSQFTELLDYIKEQWDMGSIEVLTPSGLCFADPNSKNRLSLNTDGSFERLTIENHGLWNSTGNWNNQTIETTGGKTGSNFLRIYNSSANGGVTQRIDNLDQLGVCGGQFLFECWIRSYESEDITGAIRIEDSFNLKNLQIIHQVESSDSMWKHVRFSFGIPSDTKSISISLYNLEGNGIDWDDVSIKII
ncbi:MAG: polysaccharide deacetylase family protein [Oscillospiraceae bacterium]